jgi:Predicted membrane protein
MAVLPAWMRLTFKGRINRFRYFWYPIGVGFIIAIPDFIFLGIYGLRAVALGEAPPFVSSIHAIIQLLNTLYLVSFGVRRLKDLDKSGWLILVLIIPLVNVGLFLYLLFFKGTDGQNQYGPDPLEYERYSDYLDHINGNNTSNSGNRFERAN